MEHKLAVWIVTQLEHFYHREGIERAKLEYGMEVLIDNILKVIVILGLSFLLGTLKESLFVFIGFSILRIEAGGCHCDTNFGCWMISIAIIVGGGFLSSYYIMPKEIVIAILTASLYVVAKYAPSGTKNNPIHPKYRKRMKIKSILFVIGCFVVAVIDKKSGIASMLTIGTVCEAISLLPWMNRKYKKELSNV